MRPLQAHCHLGLGKLYRRAGRADRARIELTAAVEMLRAMDVTFWLPEAETELSGAIGDPNRVISTCSSRGRLRRLGVAEPTTQTRSTQKLTIIQSQDEFFDLKSKFKFAKMGVRGAKKELSETPLSLPCSIYLFLRLRIDIEET
jgi:hypothetical protein